MPHHGGAMSSWVLKKLPNGSFELVPRAELSAWIERNYPDRCKKTTVQFSQVERGRWRCIDGQLVKVSGDEAPRKGRGLQIIKDIEPYKNVGVDNGVISSRRQHREMLKRHDLVEVGNEKPRPHPRDVAAKRFERPMREIVESLKKNSGGKWL